MELRMMPGIQKYTRPKSAISKKEGKETNEQDQQLLAHGLSAPIHGRPNLSVGQVEQYYAGWKAQVDRISCQAVG
jgi:hypothetical protein